MASAFSLVKWYLDCVTAAGDVAILYCAELHWRGTKLAYNSILSVQDGAIASHASLGGYQLSSADDRILVEFPRLGVSGTWSADAQPFRRTVYESPAGSVEWNCLQPRSRVTVRVGAHELTGLGYAECLTLTLPPWKLPMRELRWGRFVSPEDSLAWIDWQGEYAASFAIHNGQARPTLAVSDCAVVLDGAALRMEESFTLRAGKLGSTVLPGTPALGRLLPRSLFHIEEQKWRSRGVLQTRERGSEGWIIHEVVHWNA